MITFEEWWLMQFLPKEHRYASEQAWNICHREMEQLSNRRVAETIANQQATIDRLLLSLKLNVPNCEAAFCNAKATYEYHDYEGTFCKCEKHKGSLYEINDDWNDAVKLIAEIEAGK